MTKNKKTSKGEVLTAEEVSEKYTVVELKSILKENGLKVSGKKKDLVQRVLPILNEDAEKADSAQTDDEGVAVTADLISSALNIFGMNYDDLDIKDKISMGDETTLNIRGFIQDGLSMSDSTMSIMAASDSSNIDLNMSIPEVSYSNFENTIFTFKNLDLFILPSSDPQTLEFSAIMDSLEIITEKNYVNLKGLNLFFKSFADENGVRLDIDIKSFIYPDFNGTSINFDDLDLNISIGLDGQKLDISVSLPSLTLLNKNYRVNLSDLDLNVLLSDLNLSDLDLSIGLPDFHYTNFDDVHIDMENVNVSLEHIPDSLNFNVFISMDSLDAAGLNSFDEMFPMLNITEVNIKTPTDDSEYPVNLTAVISLLDITKMDFSSIISLLTSGFDLDTYLANMSSQYEGSLDGAEGSDFDISGFDLGSIFANCDYSSLDAIVINLSGLLDSLDIDLAEFGVDMSDYDLSAISVSDFIDALKDSDFVGSAFTAGSKLLSLDFDKIDLSGLIVSFDADNFDISGLLNSLNLSELDAASILNLIKSLVNMDLDGIFENGDYSSLEAIVIDLPKFLDSLGIDLAALGIDFAALGIDLSEYDLSAISLADLIGILSNINLDMETIAPILKQFGINLDEIDLSGLIAIFDEDNFDINSLLESLNLSGVDVSSILNLINSLADIDWAGIFENCDLSCLDAIVLDLSGLIDSIGMDLSALGIDESKIDFSAIALSDLIGILSNFDFDMTTIDAILKSFGIDLDKIDWSGLVTSFDEDSFDMSSLLASLDLSELDISAIVDMFNDSDVDWAGIFENADYSCFDAIVLDLTGLLDSAGMDLSALGIDESQLDLSAIRASDLIGIFTNSEFDMSMFDLSAIDFESLDVSDLLVSFDEDKFDITGLLESLDLSELDVSAVIDMFTNSDVDLAGVFENADYSCFDAIVLDLSSLIDSLGIDLAALGIDESQLDFSAIRVSDLIGILSNFDLNMDTVAAILKSFGIDLANIDWSGILVSFDEDKFDITGLLESLNLSDLDVSAILDLLISLVEIDWAGIFENGDFSCFDAIVLDLSGLIDPLGIDLAALGIDESEYDFSAIKLSDLLTIVTNFNFDMETITALLKSFGIDLDAIDWEALMASFNDENFDMSALLDSIDLAGLDISSIPELINSLGDINWAGIFENGDFSCFDAIVLDLSGLIDSLDIDLADFDIDVSDYDLSAIKLSDLIDALCKSEFIMTAINAILKLCDIDWDNLDWSGLIVSFDEDNFDISGLLGSLNLPWDISGILQMFDENGFDLSEFMNNTLSMFMVETVAE